MSKFEGTLIEEIEYILKVENMVMLDGKSHSRGNH